jgi:hypothetical protein
MDSGILPVSLLFEKSLYIKYIYIAVKNFNFSTFNGMVPFRRLDCKYLQSVNNNTKYSRMTCFRLTLECFQ